MARNSGGRDGRGRGQRRDTEDAYERYLRSARYRESRSRKAEVIWCLCAENLLRAKRIADLGSGTGLVKKELERYSGKCIYGFEMDRSFVACKEGTAVADVRCLPVRDGTLDFVLLNHVYEHVEDQQRLFGEVARVLSHGGRAYLAAGNRLAVREPHYRLPFLSWLPRRAADRYLRLTGRGRAYEGIRFRTYASLSRLLEKSGLQAKDVTEEALDRLREVTGGAWRWLWSAARRGPGPVRRGFLRWFSPQWFFLLEKRPPNGAQEEGGTT